MNNYKQYISNGKSDTFTFGVYDKKNEKLVVLINGNDISTTNYFYDSNKGSITLYGITLNKGDNIEIYTTTDTDTNTTSTSNQDDNNINNDFVKTISRQLHNLEKSLKEYTNINIKKLLEEDLYKILDNNLKTLKKYNDNLIFNNDTELTKIKKSVKNYEDIEKKVFEIKQNVEDTIKKAINELEVVYESGKVLDSGCSIEYSDRIGNRTFGLALNKKEDSFDFYNIENNNKDRVNLLQINKQTGNILPGFNGAQSLGQKNKQFKTVELSEGVIIKSIGDTGKPQRFMIMVNDNGEIITERI